MTRHGHPVRSAQWIHPARPLTLTRRHIVSGALGLAGASAIGAGLTRLDSGLVVAQDAAPEFAEPPVCRSASGVLETILVAQEQTPGGLGTMTFGGIVPGPTLRLSRGERLRIKLVNRLPQPEDLADTRHETNLHVHGLHVSPLGHGDDVFHHIMPGDAWVYEYDIRPDHQPGLFWYHPHRHHNAKAQVEAGLAGAIIIEGDLDDLPQTKDFAERLLVLQGPFVPGITSGFVVNGLVNPTLRIQHREQQRWRILNASYATFFNLELEGHIFRRISVDGNNLREIVETPTLLLGPAERAEVLIVGESPGSYELRSVPWEGSVKQGRFPLATLVSEPALEADAAGATPAVSLAKKLIEDDQLPDLRNVRDPVERQINFGNSDTIKHRAGGSWEHFDPNRVDQWVKLGATERWIVRNHTGLHWHPFHLHVNDLQVVKSNGKDQLQPFVFYKDTVPVPAADGSGDGEVVLLIHFLHFTGKFVYHCHILEHEDNGMMGVVEVVQPVDIVDSAFIPDEVEVTANTTVQWVNLDGYAHTITADDGAFESGPLSQGDEFRWTFSEAGTFSYHCEFHPKMQATIVVPEVVEPVEPLEVAVDIVDSAFDPVRVEIAACTTVQWTNREDLPHTIAAIDGSFDSGSLNPGDTYVRSFYAPGTFTYRCADHPDIEGTVVVT